MCFSRENSIFFHRNAVSLIGKFEYTGSSLITVKSEKQITREFEQRAESFNPIFARIVKINFEAFMFGWTTFSLQLARARPGASIDSLLRPKP